MVDIACRIVSKVATREGAIIPLRLVEHGNMWRDAFFLAQPVQHRNCPVSGISNKPTWLETEALFGPFDHGFCCADLGLANSAGGLDIHDDAELHVDEIVAGVSEECWPLVRSGPLRRRIGWRDELRDNVAGGALSSRVARYSFTARLDLAGSRSLRQSRPAIERCLLASAWIRLAST